MRRRTLLGRAGALAAALFAAMAATLSAPAARAGDFDAQGVYRPDPAAVAYLDFAEEPERYMPEDVEEECLAKMYETATDDEGLDGAGLLRLDTEPNCVERFLVDLPPEKGSYRATLWMRHGSVGAQMRVQYDDGSGKSLVAARFAPTGRATSDGWIELATNEFPVDGAETKAVYLRISSYAAEKAVDLDALEIVRAGEYVADRTCTGRSDPVCGPERTCLWGQCVLGRLHVPPLPADGLRDEMVDMMSSRLKIFFGGRRTRKEDLPTALATLESIRGAKTAWAFWSGWAKSIRQLHDWHTSAGSAVPGAVGPNRRLNVCFIEGDADASHHLWPKDPKYPDVLVSHVGSLGTLGLRPGDRLVAIDGLHPLAWAVSLVETDWGHHAATDPDVFAELTERLGGPPWTGGAVMLKYAKAFTVLRCQPESGTCSGPPETIQVADVPNETGDWDVACDNRPVYYLEPEKSPNPANHYVFWDFFRGRVAGTTEDEKIYGMIWDTLYGGGDPNGHVNGHIASAFEEWKSTARGVILDHRAGSGGTLDAPENVTKHVRPPGTAAVIRMPMEIAGDDGPETPEEGIAIFQAFAKKSPYSVGSPNHDPDLPVALLIHRDGSASDYLPYGMKGAPKVKIFGPHATAGAFSTFIQFAYWGGISFQIASGDTIGADGSALIGHGVQPDFVVPTRQSDLLAGKDSLFEAALAWVRSELKEPAP